MARKAEALSPEAAALRDYMRMLCRTAYEADWIDHLEYALWHALVNGPMRYGRLDIEDEHLQTLRRLSDACEGWIYVEPEAGGAQWIPLHEWQDLYSRHVDIVHL